jgi:hypothetical protein
MTDPERTLLMGELIAGRRKEALARVRGAQVEAAMYWSKEGEHARTVLIAKRAAVEVALVADGAMFALGEMPSYARRFGEFGRHQSIWRQGWAVFGSRRPVLLENKKWSRDLYSARRKLRCGLVSREVS